MDTLTFIRQNVRFLGFGLLLMLSSNLGQTFYISLFGAAIRDDFNLGNAEFGAIYSAATMCSALMLAWVGRRIDVLDLRLYVTLVLVGVAVATALLGASTNIYVLGLALFGLRLGAQGLMGHAAVTSMARYFEGRRGRAMSFAALGLPLGEATFPLLAVTALAAIGWRQTWVLSGILVALLIPVFLWLLQGHGERHSRHVEETSSEAEESQWSRRDVLRDKRYYLVIPGVLMPPFVLTGLFFHQTVLAAAKGWTLEWLATAFVGYAVLHVVASLVCGFLVDRFGALKLLVFYQVPLLMGMLVLVLVDDAWAAAAYLSLAGATTGASLPVVNAMWAETYGVTHLGAIKAMNVALMVFATAVSPIAAGMMLDAGISFETIITFTAMAVGVSVGLLWLRRFF
ncbi:MAG: MFS transporter [Rhodospirillaceae bacterium]|nr:MFS transporter [Rhodospirillaceae bacterium]MBT4219503.1 MFS transporter [Rhodospirillaceae bacterium]MBT4464028.1 MFS transporter [Rhodospirillaceae bacterium]MBT5308102.1 MFS transporter [Rhodospirillaceae bacterium]MBT7356007.1 MFS transporter [Rhodospirillaceae bacterium]